MTTESENEARKRVAEARRRAERQGDPLRLTASPKERKKAAKQREKLVGNPPSRGRMEEITDPYAKDRTETVRRSVTTDYIHWLFSRGGIERVERDAADAFSALWQEARVAPTQAIDYGRVRVDGGGRLVDHAANALTAISALQAIRAEIGPRHYAMLAMVAGEGMNASQAALAYKAGAWRLDAETWRGFHEMVAGEKQGVFVTPLGAFELTRADRDGAGRILRESLADLCHYWGWGAEASGPNWAFVRAVRGDMHKEGDFQEGVVETPWAADQAERRDRRGKSG